MRDFSISSEDSTSCAPPFLWLTLTAAAVALMTWVSAATEHGIVLLVAVSILIVLARELQTGFAVIIAAVAGVAWFAVLPSALVYWDTLLQWLSLCIPAASLSAITCIASLIAKSRARAFDWILIPLAWVLIAAAFQTLLRAPIALSPFVIASSNWPKEIGVMLGYWPLEAYCVLVSVLLSHAATRPTKTTMCAFAACLVLPFFPHWLSPPRDVLTSEVPFITVQPNLSTDDYDRSSWSTYARLDQVRLIHTLTERALRETNGGLVLWPENATRSANGTQRTRVTELSNLLSRYPRHELFATGRDATANNRSLNSVAHYTAHGLDRVIGKTILVPFAERGLSPGHFGVVQTQWGRVGIAICFEALFDYHYRRLVQAGADVIVILTNDSSLRHSTLPDLHRAYTSLFSAIHRVPTLFVDNGGISQMTDSSGRVVAEVPPKSFPTIINWTELVLNDRDLATDASVSVTWFALWLIPIGSAVLRRFLSKDTLFPYSRRRAAGTSARFAIFLTPLLVSYPAVWSSTLAPADVRREWHENSERLWEEPRVGTYEHLRPTGIEPIWALALAVALHELGEIAMPLSFVAWKDGGHSTCDSPKSCLVKAAQWRGYQVDTVHTQQAFEGLLPGSILVAMAYDDTWVFTIDDDKRIRSYKVQTATVRWYDDVAETQSILEKITQSPTILIRRPAALTVHRDLPHNNG